MNEDQVRQLSEINLQFYRQWAVPFAQTRARVQPGVRRLLEGMSAGARVLDLGCGAAQAAHWMALHQPPAMYVGADHSEELLRIASSREYPFAAEFLHIDLLSGTWQNALAGSRFDRIFLFAVLHHIPGKENRQWIAHALSGLLEAHGQLWMSNWQFLRSPKLAARILPWETVGVDDQKLEPGDYLLDWRQGGRGLRYVHIIDTAERMALAASAGLREIECFCSDGKEKNGSDYSIWGKS